MRPERARSGRRRFAVGDAQLLPSVDPIRLADIVGLGERAQPDAVMQRDLPQGLARSDSVALALLASALRCRELLVLRVEFFEETRQVGPLLRGRMRCRLERPCQPGPRFLGLGQRGLAGGISAGEAVVQFAILPA